MMRKRSGLITAYNGIFCGDLLLLRLPKKIISFNSNHFSPNVLRIYTYTPMTVYNIESFQFWAQLENLIFRFWVDTREYIALCLTCCADELDEVLLAGLALVKGTCQGSETKKHQSGLNYLLLQNASVVLYSLYFSGFNKVGAGVYTYTCTGWPGCSLWGDSNSLCSVPPVVS